MKQWRKIFGRDEGWQIIATIDHGWGVGIFWHGRWGGYTIALGPLMIDVQPPLPAFVPTSVQK